MKPFSAVIPAAGLGTRFLPFTKTVPKELVPILQTPALDLILQELIAGECFHACVITNPEKIALRDYVQHNPTLDKLLRERHEYHLLEPLYKTLEKIALDFVDQKQPYGLGHAVLQAQPSMKKGESFAVVLPDDLIVSTSSLVRTLATISAEHNNALVLTVQEVPRTTVSSYGIVGIGQKIADSLFTVDSVIEKPTQEEAPSCYAILGRYCLPYAIFAALEKTTPGHKGEIQLTDAIKIVLKEKTIPVLAYVTSALRFDIGTPTGWLAANNYYAQTKKIT